MVKNIVVLELVSRFENRIMKNSDRQAWKMLVLDAMKEINTRADKDMVDYHFVLETMHGIANTSNIEHAFEPVKYPDVNENREALTDIKKAVSKARTVLPSNQHRCLERIEDFLKILEADNDCPAIVPGVITKSCFLKYDQKTGPRVCVDDLHTYIGANRDCPMFKSEPNNCRSDCMLWGTYKGVASNINAKRLTKSNTDLYKEKKA